MENPLFNYMIENQSIWARAYNEKKKKYKYEKQREEKRRLREKKEALLNIEVIEAIEENK